MSPRRLSKLDYQMNVVDERPRGIRVMGGDEIKKEY